MGPAVDEFTKNSQDHSGKWRSSRGRLYPWVIRLRLEGEKAYLFCVVRNAELQNILLASGRQTRNLNSRTFAFSTRSGRDFKSHAPRWGKGKGNAFL